MYLPKSIVKARKCQQNRAFTAPAGPSGPPHRSERFGLVLPTLLWDLGAVRVARHQLENGTIDNTNGTFVAPGDDDHGVASLEAVVVVNAWTILEHHTARQAANVIGGDTS